ncbi:MAG: lactonase family protein [Lachnospiraceae bacterium]|nr:lactonase family protein [Lachnospiraceae bacterium]
MAKKWFYVGTYTHPILFGTGEIFTGKGKGIYRLCLDDETGEIALDPDPAPAVNPSFVALSPDRKFLYAVNELKEFNGAFGGSASAFAVAQDGTLTYLNSQPTMGTDPCHVAVNAAQTHVYVSNFMSGSVTVFPILEDGSLGEASDFHQHEGHGPIEARQKGPHAHSLTFSADQKFAFVPDLGIDQLVIYKTDFENGKLIPADVPFLQTFPGAGPRHCEFHPNQKWCYLINEIACSISLLYYHAEDGTFTLEQTVDTIPPEEKAGNICADLHITPDGRFLYGSNRGHDSLTAFSIDPETGHLTQFQSISCGGSVPRNFCIEKGGKFLLCGNQNTDNVAVFKICQECGKLTQIFDLPVPTPVCLREM